MSRRVHRGASVLQQSGGGGQSLHASQDERLPLQEGDGDLQLQLLQQHPGSPPQQTGSEGGSAFQSREVRVKVFIRRKGPVTLGIVLLTISRSNTNAIFLLCVTLSVNERYSIVLHF